ncbi:hypothetical protein COF68_05055 [Bacillus toyonensis]|uniref:helix-turn-helix domain-containing protein n=1 Tax=Bacillus toyonensis TaxID=155322 RepID=UPI000BFD6AAE|nr:helix-turn-helix transcriptional regulator [Bacillus toyonensis]PHE64215.1 hypothetical protein COF68_05055 [Bacillus toyonensis]
MNWEEQKIKFTNHSVGEINYVGLVELLVSKRLEKGLTQKELAQYLPIDEYRLSKIEDLSLMEDINIIADIGHALGLNLTFVSHNRKGNDVEASKEAINSIINSVKEQKGTKVRIAYKGNILNYELSDVQVFESKHNAIFSCDNKEVFQEFLDITGIVLSDKYLLNTTTYLEYLATDHHLEHEFKRQPFDSYKDVPTGAVKCTVIVEGWIMLGYVQGSKEETTIFYPSEDLIDEGDLKLIVKLTDEEKKDLSNLKFTISDEYVEREEL